MRKTTYIICAAATAFALAGCDFSAGTSSEADPPISTANSETGQSTSVSEVSDSRTEGIPETKVTVDGDSREFSLKGLPMDKSDLVSFDLEEVARITKEDFKKQLTESECYIGIDAFFSDILAKPELLDVYIEAQMLYRYTFLNGIRPPIERESVAHLITEDADYAETGINYNSFYNALTSVFTENSADTMLRDHNFIISYNDGLWRLGISTGSDQSWVHTEFEVVINSDEEVEFNEIHYCDRNSDTPSYNESEKGSLVTKTYVDRFVKTDNGWRAEKIPQHG